MPEEKSDGIKTVFSGWVKAVTTSVVGLVSGAVIMYLTPLVNSAIKPAKPVANFAAQVSGLTVNFNNRSTGATQGWWDFGDGTALEPFDPKSDLVKHTYARPGSYSVKLALRNLLGDESDRVAQVTLDPESAPRPEIVSFVLVPLTPGERVPAVYRLQGKVKAATHCILSLGDERPTEVLDDAVTLDRYITFNEMGSYTVRLSAVNGKQLVEKTQTVFVSPNDSTNPLAKLLVTYQAVRVDQYKRDMKVHCAWQGDVKESVSAFRRERPADVGCTFISAELANKGDPNAPVKNVSVTIAPDKKKIVVAGELIKPKLAGTTGAPSWLADVKVVMERRSPPQTISRGDVSMMVSPGKTIVLPLQPLEEGWEVIKKDLRLELWDGQRKVWEGSKAVAGAKLILNNQTCLVTATPQSDGFALKIDASGLGPPPPVTVGPLMPPSLSPQPVGPIRKTGFESNPLLPKRQK